jgi:flagellar assembly protein FliH
MFSSNQAAADLFSVPVSVFQYPPSPPAISSLPRIEASASEPEELILGITLTEEALASRLAAARAEGAQQAEGRLRQEYEARDTSKIVEAVRAFDRERSQYFSRVEREIVHLALSIAGKILHREAQVDPMLMAALVRIALTQLKDGSAVTVRVRPGEGERWRRDFAAGPGQSLQVTVVEDAGLEPGGCMLETELGSANFALDAQLKEVEQGFFDVLAQRP